MADKIEIKVPDIGDFEGVEVIEVLVSAGDSVEAEQPLITLESDKATMEVPAPQAGTIAEISVNEGDKVSEGDVIGTLAAGDAETDGNVEADNNPQEDEVKVEAESESASPLTPHASQEQSVKVPDIGDFEAVEVIEVLVSEGDEVEAEQPLITLESDKATMEVPAPSAGKIVALKVSEVDKVSEGDEIATLAAAGEVSKTEQSAVKEDVAEQEEASAPQHSPATERKPAPSAKPSPAAASAGKIDEAAFRKAHASPSVRAFARELGVDLGRVNGSGRKGRITKEDVQQFVKGVMSGQAAGAAAPAAGGAGIPVVQLPDYSKFGEIETVELPRIRKISAAHLHKCWLNVPHVTQFDEADITEMEAFRQAEKDQHEVKITPLAFLLKACAIALTKFPDFNSAITPDGSSLIVRKYVHIGFAADTPNGLVVPVVRDADKKGILQLAKEAGELAKKARDGKLGPSDMQGGCFSISSLGGIGGTAFTPIVNSPEVAILGVSKSSMQPVWDGQEFQPRLMLPLSLSYDHRVIDGAAAARFTGYLSQLLGDIRRLTL